MGTAPIYIHDYNGVESNRCDPPTPYARETIFVACLIVGKCLNCETGAAPITGIEFQFKSRRPRMGVTYCSGSMKR